MDAHDFLIKKFGYFNPAHPLSHLGYAKGIELYIEDIVSAIEEYKVQSMQLLLDAEIIKGQAELELAKEDDKITLATWIAALLHVKSKVEEFVSKRPVL